MGEGGHGVGGGGGGGGGGGHDGPMMDGPKFGWRCQRAEFRDANAQRLCGGGGASHAVMMMNDSLKLLMRSKFYSCQMCTMYIVHTL